MADLGHQLTDKELEQLEKRIAREYAIAAKDMRRKLRDYMEQFEEGKAAQKALLDAGKITKKQYQDWIYRHTMMGNQWRDMKNVLADDLKRANDIALRMSRDQMADIYALNANYAMFQIEHDFAIDTGFTLYNHDTAEYLLSEQRQLMPGPSARKAKEIAENKAMQWNRQKIQSAVLQGVLQGESPYEVAKRLTGVAQMGYNASVRYARTMTTSAQNAGRYNSYRRAKGLGVDLTIEWQATLDGRTRHEHRMMHGQRRDVDEPFEVDGVKILYPAQSDGPGSSDIPQSLIWNCRCTLLAWVKGFEGDTVKSSPKMAGMSFEEWQHAKEPKKRAEKKPEFVSRFQPAKSIQEAEKFIEQICDKSGFGAVGVSYAGVDLDVANIVNKTLIDLYDEFDVKKFGGVIAPAGNTKLGKQMTGATAGYSPIRNSFLLNRKSLGSVKLAGKALAKETAAITDILTHPEKYDLDRASKQLLSVINASRLSGRATVPTTIPGVLYHEFGHALEKQMRKLDFYEDIKANMSEYAERISGYATQDVSEYIAESFASWRLGENIADPLIVRAFNMLRRK